MDTRSVIAAIIGGFIVACAAHAVPVARAQSAAAPHGVVCDYSSSPGGAADWIAEQLKAGRVNILMGGTSAYIFCAY